jgi:hypothetical protein
MHVDLDIIFPLGYGEDNFNISSIILSDFHAQNLKVISVLP